MLKAAEMRLTGTYQGKNLYVQNPSASDVGFCVHEVHVNGEVTTDDVGLSAFEIDLKRLRLKIDDPLEVTLFHRPDCRPKVLNPEVLQPDTSSPS